MSVVGRFVWHDLLSTDVDVALEFYSALFAWEVRDRDMGALGTYHVIRSGERDIGGVVATEEGKDANRWLSYVAVDDVDDVVQRAPDAGARVVVPGVDIPEVGRFAVITDPGGSHWAPFRFAADAPTVPDGPPARGTVSWVELVTRDPQRSAAYYSDACGWEPHEVDVGPTGTYTFFRRGETNVAGMLPMPPSVSGPPQWLIYIEVESADEVAARFEELGGSLHLRPRDIPGVGRIAVGADPNGARIAVFQSAVAECGGAEAPGGSQAAS